MKLGSCNLGPRARVLPVNSPLEHLALSRGPLPGAFSCTPREDTKERPGSEPRSNVLYMQGLIPTPFDAGTLPQFIQFGACRLDTLWSVEQRLQARTLAQFHACLSA